MATESKAPAPGGAKMKRGLCPQSGQPEWGNWASGTTKDYRCTKCGSPFGKSHTEVR